MSPKNLLKVFDNNANYTPVWFMRQAGRYLPEYRKLRESKNSFLDLCYDKKAASEVTLQPLRRFAFDAAIIFSDILVIPHALGIDVKFAPNEGPILQKIDSEQDLEICSFDEQVLLPVYEALKLVKQDLPEDKALIGFCGAPWTLACYMVEGRGNREFPAALKALYKNKIFFDKLIDKLTDVVIIHLKNQIKAGADIVQIFDSWAGILSADNFYRYVVSPTEKIISSLKEFDKNIKIIGFPRGAGVLYKDFQNAKPDAISIDQFTPLSWAKENLSCVVQGNLDPLLLAYDKEGAVLYTKKILQLFNGQNFIFNLGHGIVPETPLENVEAVIDEVVKFNNNCVF